MTNWRMANALMLVAIACPAFASHYLVLSADETSRTYVLPGPLHSARLVAAGGSLTLSLNQKPVSLDDSLLKSFVGAQFESAVLARDPSDGSRVYVLIDCDCGRLVLVVSSDRKVEYRDEDCHDV
jgi:hypothetical protein